MLTSARLPHDSAEVVLVGDGWLWVVSTGFPARDRPGSYLVGVIVDLDRSLDNRGVDRSDCGPDLIELSAREEDCLGS